jgi:hypothetical protein
VSCNSKSRRFKCPCISGPNAAGEIKVSD